MIDTKVMKSNRNNHIRRYLFCMALAMGMVFVYPVHVIVDHAGLFESHQHDTGDGDHSGDQASKDEICIYCLSLDSMEVSESQELKYENHPVDYDSPDVSVAIDSSMGSKSVRAPPASFDARQIIQTV